MAYNIGLKAAGGYLPRGRIDRADIFQAHAWALQGLKAKSKGQRSAAAWDEDAITMGIEAARIASLDQPYSSLDHLTFASTSHPFRDRSSAAIASSALAMPAQLITMDAGTNRRSATTALLQAIINKDKGASAILAGEKRLAKAGSWAEILWGDAGAAVIVDDQDPTAILVGWSAVTEDCIDFFTADGFPPYAGEERWIKDQIVKPIIQPAITRALENAGLTGQEIQWAVLPDVVPGTEKQLARGLGLQNAQLATQIITAKAGDLGAAHPLFGLALALEQANIGDHILICGFGNGCDTLIFKVIKKPHVPHKSIANQLDSGSPLAYTAFATGRGIIDLDFGPRAERVEKTALSVHERARRDITPFIGGKVSEEGQVQFPKTPVSQEGGFTTEKDYMNVRLADLRARVVSYTADHLTYTPEPPLHYGLVQFDNGARVLMEYVDVPAPGLSPGSTVEMRFRIKSIDRERGYRHYFWKAAPLSESRGRQ